MRDPARITAVLGPTNTGKTHYAIERMLAHRTGVIGLPLRLLAREVYDRIVAIRGPSVVALVTGEERIVPERTQYWVCTTEAMPVGIGADFVAVDEIQLCADPDRGHVFTERLLTARGLHETMFLGSDTMRGAIAALVPGVQFMARPRLSDLTWAGARKLSRIPARSAIVGFSVESVYAIAELIRRQKGGCAVVMGALSPRTRNAQVALYQNGDVDYLVATDAIGMGLNLDIRHVAFASTAKFDGRRIRALHPHELAQIAGRAGRHTSPGTFGVTGEARPLPAEVIEAIETHRFLPVRKLHWRNAELSFGTIDRLIASLEAPATDEWLTRSRDADDLTALKTLAAMEEIRATAATPAEVRLLWDVCRIPDFRGLSSAEHAGLLARIFGFLRGGAQVPDDWLARNVARIDRTDGDIDAISRRLAYIRTWTYVAQRKGWVADESHWRGETRAVEDRLSDALHTRLTQRFVDRRTSVLMRRLKQKEGLVAEVNDKGEVAVEGEFAGRLEGFRFRLDATGGPDEARTLRQAAYEALRPEFHLRADRFYNAPDTEMDFTEQGGLMWGSHAVGKLVKGPEALKPQVESFVDEEAGPEIAEKVRRRLQHFIDRKVAALFEPLLALGRDEALAGLARGFGFRLVEAMGVLPREGVAEDVRALDQEARGALRRHGVRFGQFTVFLPALLKPAPTRLRLVLWSLHEGLAEFPESPPPGLVTIPNAAEVPAGHYALAGYRPAGARAIRIDMLERLADLLRAKDSRAGFEATPDMLSITGMTLEQFADLMQGLGYRAEKAERARVKPAPPEAESQMKDGVEAVEPASETTREGQGAEVADSSAGSDAVDAAGDAAGAETVTGAPEVAEPGDAEAGETPTGPAAQEAPAPDAGTGEVPEEAAPEDGTASEPAATAEPMADAEPEPAAEPAAKPAVAEEMEVFYTFTWAPRQRGPRGAQQRRDGGGRDGAEGAARGGGERRGKPGEGRKREAGGGERGERGPKGGGPKGKGGKPGGKPRDSEPQRFESRPPREKKADPDSPFAVLAALRDRS